MGATALTPLGLRSGHDAAPRRAKPGFGQGTTCTGATALRPPSWHQAAGMGGRDIAPSLARPRMGRGTTCVGAAAPTPLSWRGAARRGGHDASPAWQGPGWAETPRARVPRPLRCVADAERQGGRARDLAGLAPPGEARDGPGHRVLGPRPLCRPADAEQQEGRGASARCPSQPGEARDGQGHHFHGCHCPQVAQLSRSIGGGGGEIANPDSRCRSPPGEAMDWPGCPGPKCESVTACRCSKEGRAQCRSPPGEARAGPGRHMLGGHGPRAVRLTQPRNSEDSAEEGRAQCSSPRGKARDEPGHRVRWCRCRRSAWLTQSSR